MIIKEELHNLTNKEFETLLEYIGYDNLRFMLIQRAEGFPKTCKYYIGKNGNGSFWSGFRTEKLPMERVKKFYIEEVWKNSSELNLEEFFDDILRINLLDFNEDGKIILDRKILDEKINLKENGNLILKIEDLDILNLYAKLYGIEIDDKDLKKIEESIDAKNQFEEALSFQEELFNEKILKITEENEAQVAKLNKKIESLNNKITKRDNEIISLNNKIEALNGELPNMVSNKIKTIFKCYASKEAMNLFNDLDIFNEEDANEAFKTTVSELNNLLYNKKYSKLEDKIILQYLIIKLLESQREGE